MDPAYVMQMGAYGGPLMTPEGMMHMTGMVPMPGMQPMMPGPAMQMVPPRYDAPLPMQNLPPMNHTQRQTSIPTAGGVDSAVSTAPQTPKLQAGPELELGADSNPAVLSVRNSDVLLIKVPDFVADTWMAQKPGTVLGVLNTTSSNPKRVGVHFPRKLDLPVAKIQPNHKKAVVSNTKSILHGRDSSEVVLSAVGAGHKRSWPLNTTARIEGQIIDQIAYLPDISDPRYRMYLEKQNDKSIVKEDNDVKKTPIVLSAEESARLHQKLTEDVSEATTSKRLFHYYGQSGEKGGAAGDGGAGSDEDDLDSSSNVGSNVGGGGESNFRNNKKRKPTQLSTEEGQAKLFRFFESKANQPASMKEIVCFLGTTQTFTKQLLDQIAEPVRERQGKRVSFILKPEYRGSA